MNIEIETIKNTIVKAAQRADFSDIRKALLAAKALFINSIDECDIDTVKYMLEHHMVDVDDEMPCQNNISHLPLCDVITQMGLTQHRDPAKYRSYFDIFKMLLDYNADLFKHEGNERTTPCHVLMHCEVDEALCEVIVRNSSVNKKIFDGENRTPLHVAAYEGYMFGIYACVKYLGYESCFDMENQYGQTPQMEAEAAGNDEVAQIMEHEDIYDEYLVGHPEYKTKIANYMNSRQAEDKNASDFEYTI